MYDKVVSLGTHLHYPITITKLLKVPGDTVKKQEHIVEYKWNWRRRVDDGDETTWFDETSYTEFDSPAEGTLKEWRIREGMVIRADMPCMLVEEACGHEVQMSGMCSMCGADMTETNWASDEKDTDRASINMTHDQTGLMVSRNVARRSEHEAQKRLLRQRKLSLVVDLDQTIIHACIEPTVGEWQGDPSNPNHDAVKDVKSFQLNDDGPRGVASGCTYYIKLRPGLREFLEEVSHMYELHVYTMGTRAYAQNIAKIVDPDKKLFGNRVISRDENGSITSKNLQRLFPVSTDMVVIIDDRSDVWPNNRPNLIKVVPYDFFKGIGDINSSFLPKRQDLAPTIPKANGGAAKISAPAESVAEELKASPMDDLAQMSGSNSAESLKVQTEEQEKSLEKQIKDRPMLHMQEMLDKEDEKASEEEAGGDNPSSGGHHRQHLLNDDDEELISLQDHLTDLHTAFYETYDRRRAERVESRPLHPPGHAPPRRPSADDGVDLSMVPDVGDILEELKSNVLSGLVIVLSGIVPLGTPVEESEIGLQVQSFGAAVHNTISRRVTHLVVSTERPQTKKAHQAAKIPSIRIVNQNWLLDCLSQWRHLEEGPYILDMVSNNRTADEPVAALSDGGEDETGIADEDSKGLYDFDDDPEFREMMEAAEDDADATDNASVVSSEADTDIGPNDATEDESDVSESRKRSGKRKFASEDGETESVLAKKQRVARARGASGLRSVHVPGEDEDEDEAVAAADDRDANGDEEEAEREGVDYGDDGGDGGGGKDDLADELERDFMAELEDF